MDAAHLIKDYQTLIASIIALTAACIAYYSAQKVAQSARNTALELAEKTHFNADRDKLDQEKRLRLAILLELRSDCDAFRLLHAYRIKFAEMLCAGSPDLDEIQIPFSRYELAFSSLKLTLDRLNNLLIMTIGAKEMSVLDMQTQRNIHFAAFSIHNSESTLKDLSEDLQLRSNRFILGIEIKNFRDVVEAAAKAEEHVRLFLNAKLQEIEQLD